MSDRKYRFPRGRNAGLRAKGPKAAAPSAASKEKTSCEPMTPTCIAAASASAVSPAISLPVSPASSREQQKIETQGSQCSNQSGSNPQGAKPNCYACQHRRELVGDAHSRCANPRISDEDAIITPILLLSGRTAPAMKRLNIVASDHGVRNGWFMWPVNFDPTWLITCDGYAAKEPA